MHTCIARWHHKHSFERIGKWKHFVEFGEFFYLLESYRRGRWLCIHHHHP